MRKAEEERAGICQIRSGEKCHRAWSCPEAIDCGREEVKEILGAEVPGGGGPRWQASLGCHAGGPGLCPRDKEPLKVFLWVVTWSEAHAGKILVQLCGGLSRGQQESILGPSRCVKRTAVKDRIGGCGVLGSPGGICERPGS